MKFKKGDIVEVIKDDKWQGIDYHVGTQLRVYKNQGDESVVHIYDSVKKQGGFAKLWEWNLKLLKREEDDNELKFKIGDKVYGQNRHNTDRIVGEIVGADKHWGYRIKVLNADYKYAWLDTETVKLILEETPDQKAIKEETTVYTKSEINQQISIAYQQFDNNSQRLAYLQGYFAK